MPNKNAHIESFHAILEEECLSRHEFESYAKACEVVDKFMRFYNKVRIHSAIKFFSPMECYQLLRENRLKLKPVRL
ncbi:MAG: integrase core domain-containing protein [Peptococcaceae bacterium]|nr:integrase core domain-containing protein [Peptococcaceae bacterium]